MWSQVLSQDIICKDLSKLWGNNWENKKLAFLPDYSVTMMKVINSEQAQKIIINRKCMLQWWHKYLQISAPYLPPNTISERYNNEATTNVFVQTIHCDTTRLNNYWTKHKILLCIKKPSTISRSLKEDISEATSHFLLREHDMSCTQRKMDILIDWKNESNK